MKKKMRKIASFFLAMTLISQSPVGIMAGELDLFSDSAETVWMQPENKNEDQPEETNSENTQRGIDTFEADADQADVFFTDGDMGTDVDTSPEEPDSDAEEPYGENNDSEGQIGLEEEESLTEPDAEQGYMSGELSEDSEMPAFSAGTEESQELFMAGSTSGSYGSLKWSVTGSTLSITGSGEMQDAGHATYYPWYPYRSMITSITLGSGITSLGEAAFYGSGVQQISFPSTMRKISTAAFAECHSLKTVTLNEGLTTIGDYVFQNTAIESITLPASLTSMSNMAMWGNRKLKTIAVKSGNQTYAASDGVLFSRDKKTLIYCPINLPARTYTVPSGVTKIGAYAFCSSNLSEIKISSGVKELGDGVFYKSSITSLSLPDSVTKIGDFLCQDCINLTTVSTGNGLIALAYRTFSGCSSLRNVTLGTSLEDLDYLSFAECRSLESIVIPSKVKVIKNGSFGDCTSLSKVVFPSGLEEIWYQAFLNCSLSAITLPDGFKRVTRYAFYGTKLKEVTIPASVVEIGEHAFPDHTKLIFKRPLEQMEDNSYVNAKVVTMDVSYNYKDAFEVLRLVNNERASQGLAALTMDTSLLDSAMKRAAETSILFSHTRPTGTSCFTINNKISGENIAAGQGSPSSAMNSWMNSSGHRANILGSYVSIGVGAVVVNGTHYWVQVFGRGTAAKADESKYNNQTKATDIKFVLGNDEEDSVTIRTNPKEMTLEAGKTGTVSMGLSNTWIVNWLDAKNLSYKSSNPNICQVSSNGLVTGKAIGTAEITVFMKKYSDVNTKVKVTVKRITPVMNFQRSEYVCVLSDKTVINPLTTNTDGKVTYSSSNSSVATVDGTGKVTLKKTGTCTITASASEGKKYAAKKASYKLSIKKPIKDCQLIFTKIGSIPSSSSEFEKYLAVVDGDKILKEGQDYEFWGKSWSSSGNALYSLSVYVEGIGNYTGYAIMDIAPTGQKTILNSAVQTSKGIQLSWKKEGGAIGYEIYRKKGSGSYTMVKRISSRNTTKWTDTETVNPKAVYVYYVKAYTKSNDKMCYADKSDSKKIIPAPVLKSAVSAGYNSIKVTWEVVSGADSYTVYYKGGNVKSWKALKSGVTSTSYTHYGLSTGTPYSYTVQAVSSKSAGSYDKTGKSAKPALGTVKLGKVTSAGYDRLKITWNKAAGANGYVIYQKIAGKWKKLASLSGTSYTHIHSGSFPVLTGTANTYTVRAYRIVNGKYIYGGYDKTGITGTASLGKAVISAVTRSGNGMKLTINKSNGAAGYEIQRYNGKAWAVIASVKSNSYVDTKASKKGTIYQYRVRAYRTVNGKKVYGSFSDVKSGKR